MIINDTKIKCKLGDSSTQWQVKLLNTNRLFAFLLFNIEESTDFAFEPRKKSLLFDLNFIGGLSDVGVDSVELLIGESDGTWFCFALSVLGGDDGGIARTVLSVSSLLNTIRTLY